MSRRSPATTGSSPYAQLLTRPGAAAFFAAAGAGRVGTAMTALGLLWLVRDGTGSYAAAGAVTAGFALAEAGAGPQVARGVDRFGQTRSLLVLAPVHLMAVTTLVLVVGSAPTPGLVAVGGLAGATLPPLGALSGARWVALLGGRRDDLLPPAFSLESVVNAAAHLVGPVVVSALAQRGSAAAAALLAAGLVCAGSTVLALLRDTAPPVVARDPGPRCSPRGPLGRGFAVVLLVNVGVGGYFGASQVAVTAFAVEHDASAAGLFAVAGTAGLLAGAAYGLRRWRTSPRGQLLLLGTSLAVACGWLVVSSSPGAAVVGLVVAGAVVPPVLVLCSVLVERTVAPGVLTEAFTWVNSASAAGSAAAAAVAGVLVDGHGTSAAFALAAAAALGLAGSSRAVEGR